MLLSQLAAKVSGPAQGGMVNIQPGTYRAGGDNTPVQQVRVADEFLTPASEITNAQVDVVTDTYNGITHGVFMADVTGDKEGNGRGDLYLIGAGKLGRPLETIDKIGGGVHLLPPALGIPQGITSLEEFQREYPRKFRQTFKRFKFDPKDIREIMPSPDRYDDIQNAEAFKDPQVAATMINYYQAQAIAQLMAGRGLLEQLFGLSGTYYTDLPNEAQWGLLALEGVFKYMTRTGQLLDENGRKLRAYNDYKGETVITRPTDYPALPNGVLPNTVWNWMKNKWALEQALRVRRGGSWYDDDYDAISAFRFSGSPGYSIWDTGFRLVAVPRDS